MRLKLSGPDYKGAPLSLTRWLWDMDPVAALEDFKRRVTNYEKAYDPIGEYEEDVENLPYCKVWRPMFKLIPDDKCRQKTGRA